MRDDVSLLIVERFYSFLPRIFMGQFKKRDEKQMRLSFAH